jgi:hypothetical protein
MSKDWAKYKMGWRKVGMLNAQGKRVQAKLLATSLKVDYRLLKLKKHISK